MDAQSAHSTDNIDLEAKWFMAALRSRSSQKLRIDANTLNELAAIVSTIGELLGEAQIIPNDSNSNDNDCRFYQQFYDSQEWKHFKFDNFITCRVCSMQIGLSKEEIEVHIRSAKHRRNVNIQNLSNDDPIENTGAAGVGEPSHQAANEVATNSSADDVENSDNSSNKSTQQNNTVLSSTSSESIVVMELNDEFHSESQKNSAGDQAVKCVVSAVSTYELLEISKKLSSTHVNVEQPKLLPVDPLNAVVEKIFVRDVDDVIRMEMSLMRLNITLANQDLSAVVNVAVALKRKAYLYGSYAYGAPPDNRIVNILFDFSNIYGKSDTVPKDCSAAYTYLADHLNASTAWTNIQRVNICDQRYGLEATRKKSGTICHFTFDSSVPIAAASLIQHFFALQPMCHKVAIFIRHWQTMLNKEQEDCLTMSGYLLTVLVIFFFQFMNLLPSVCELQTGTKVICNSVNVQFDKSSKTIPASADFRTYLHRFFSFYGDVLRTAENFIISPYHGKVICRINNQKNDPKLPDNEINRSFRSMRGARWTDKNMYVQDLFIRCTNIGGSISARTIQNFQKCCALSATIMKQQE